MATATINPFATVGTQLTNGMASVASLSASGLTTTVLANQIYSYIQSVYYPSTGAVPQDIQVELTGMIYNVINGYNNSILNNASFLSPAQSFFTNMLMGPQMTAGTTPVNAIGTWISDIEDNITKAGLSVDEQNTLLLATQIGTAIYNYWVTQVTSPSGVWTSFFSSNTAQNYANIPYWVAACINGALIGATASPAKGLITPSTDIQSVTIISALAGAIAVASGKVIFGWLPRIQPMQVVAGTAQFTGGGFGGGSFNDAMVNRRGFHGGGGGKTGGGSTIIVNGTERFRNSHGTGTTTLYDFFDSSTSGPGGSDQRCGEFMGAASYD